MSAIAKEVLKKVLPKPANRNLGKPTGPANISKPTAPDSILQEFEIVDPSTLPEFGRDSLKVTDRLDAKVSRAPDTVPTKPDRGQGVKHVPDQPSKPRNRPGRPTFPWPDTDEEDSRRTPTFTSPQQDSRGNRDSLQIGDSISTTKTPRTLEPKRPKPSPPPCEETQALLRNFGIEIECYPGGHKSTQKTTIVGKR